LEDQITTGMSNETPNVLQMSPLRRAPDVRRSRAKRGSPRAEGLWRSSNATPWRRSALAFGLAACATTSQPDPGATLPAPTVSAAAPATSSQPDTAPKSQPSASAGCVRGGCSSELCVEHGTEPSFSPCIYRNEYACYETARCERGPDGACGWVRTAELDACLQDPPRE
jgi:hypothetical protein